MFFHRGAFQKISFKTLFLVENMAKPSFFLLYYIFMFPYFSILSLKREETPLKRTFVFNFNIGNLQIFSGNMLTIFHLLQTCLKTSFLLTSMILASNILFFINKCQHTLLPFYLPIFGLEAISKEREKDAVPTDQLKKAPHRRGG